MADEALARLQRAAALLFEREGERLRGLSAEIRETDSEIARLREASGPDLSAPAELSFGARARAAEAWERHRQTELARLQGDRARLAAGHSLARAAAIRAFGRVRVLEKLAGAGAGPGRR